MPPQLCGFTDLETVMPGSLIGRSTPPPNLTTDPSGVNKIFGNPLVIGLLCGMVVLLLAIFAVFFIWAAVIVHRKVKKFRMWNSGGFVEMDSGAGETWAPGRRPNRPSRVASLPDMSERHKRDELPRHSV